MYNVTQLCYVKTFSNIYLFLKMTTHRLKTQNMVKLEISTNYDTHVTVQVWRETMQQTNALCNLT